MKTWRTPQLKKLAKTFLSLKSQTDMENFLRDVCTLEEMAEMSRRWEAVLLLDADVSYREIAKKTGLSTATVTRIAHWLNHGEGGYRAALRKK
jgi:TrpR-related protein YerC/YecD